MRPDGNGAAPTCADPSVDPLVERLQMSGPLPSWLGPKPEMFNTGDAPPFAACGVDPKLLWRVPYWLRHQAALENDPAKVLQMVEAGEGLRR